MAKDREKKKGGKLKWVLIVVVALIIIGALGSEKDKVKDATPDKGKTAEATTNSVSSKSEESGQAEKTEFQIGEVAEYKDVQVSVLNYEESAGNEWGSPADGKVFVFANIEIANNSDKEISISSMVSFEGYCDDYKLDFSSEALMAASVDNRQQLDGSISPNKKLNGYLGFEVPADWSTIEIEYKDNAWLSSNFKFLISK